MAEYIKLEPRYIDINKFSIPKGFFNQDLNVPKIFDLLYSQPSADVVEVVRCRDCRYSDVYGKNCFCEYDPIETKSVSPNGYCNYGERRPE